jgi:hypothetical protein
MNGNLVKVKAPRWYNDEGGIVEACYQIPKKKGDGMKEPNITDAREMGLLPSVTTILNVMARPGLERWKLEQAIQSALTLPRPIESEGEWVSRILAQDPRDIKDALMEAYSDLPKYLESEDGFAVRVAQDMEAQANKAAEFGHRIHDAIADMLVNGIQYPSPIYPDLHPFLESFKAWAKASIEEVHAVEKVVGGKAWGYAGRLDLYCTLRVFGKTVIDIKSQNIKEGKSPIFYPDWVGQLAAYRDVVLDSTPRIMSMVINSREPGPVWPMLWSPEETINGKKMFMNCYALWMLLNDYDPS